jgi:hypothetical protein
MSFILNVILLSLANKHFMLSVFMPHVVMLNVVAPKTNMTEVKSVTQ